MDLHFIHQLDGNHFIPKHILDKDGHFSEKLEEVRMAGTVEKGRMVMKVLMEELD